MNTPEILRFCLEKGFLLDNEVLNIFNETSDVESVKLIMEKIRDTTHQRIITKNLFDQNKEKVFQIFSALPKENQQQLERLKIKLGLSIEISHEIVNEKKEEKQETKEFNFDKIKILSSYPTTIKKIEAADFTRYFRNRFSEMRKILLDNSSLKNLVSINKISNSRQGISIIGIVANKTITKNKNMLL